MIFCSKANRSVHTGLTLVEGSKLDGLEHRNFLCSACGQKHGIELAFFEGTTLPLFPASE